MEAPKPESQHKLLQSLVGDWTFESSCDMGPDKPRETFRGKETVRALGDLWIICEGEGETPGGGASQMVIQLGYDPAKGKFVGSFIASMMTHFWPYEGSLDASGKAITLESTGPSFDDPKVLKPYRDIITVVSEDERTLTSQMPDGKGGWVEFMKSQYRRVK